MIFGEFSRHKNAKSFSKQIIELSVNGTLTKLIPAESTAQWQKGNVTLVQHNLRHTSKNENDHKVLSDEMSQVTVVAWARIDNKQELTQKLGITFSERNETDASFILESYKKWGEDCVDHLVGDFAFVVFDGKQKKLFCARDHMGVRPFFYNLDDEHFIFATHLSFFHHLNCCEMEPSTKWMAEFLSNISMSFEQTAYPTILKLAPAHCLTITEDESILRQYFKLSATDELKLPQSSDYVEVYREQLEEAIKCRVDNSNAMVGSESSGGIDSSTITAYASLYMDKPKQHLHAFAVANSEFESEYIHAVSQSAEMMATHMLTSSVPEPDLHKKIISKSLAITGYPGENGNGTGFDSFFKIANKLNIKTLLSGFGGDEFVTTPATMVLKELYKKRRYKDLYIAVSGNLFTRFLRVIKIAINDKRKQRGRFDYAFSQRWKHQLLKQELTEEYDLEAKIADKALFDVPYDNLNEFTINVRWSAFVPTRMETHSLMAAARGVEYRWPLLDVRLIKLFLSIPSTEKFYRGISRYLHRRAIDHIVPKKVAWKQSKDMGDIGLVGITSSNDLMPNIEGLHHRLSDIIDTQKLSQQIEELDSLKKAGLSNKLLQVNRNINNVLWLNHWLYQFHSK